MAEPARPVDKRSKARTKPTIVRSPQTAPLAEADRRQAVTALALLIAEWHERNQNDQTRSPEQPQR
jgi:hypothetical protein